MEEERFFTGYCRCLDASRTVECLYQDGKLTEADCRYGACLYESVCTIAQAIAEADNIHSEQQKGPV